MEKFEWIEGGDLQLFDRSAENKLPILKGYAAKFNTYSRLMYDFYTVFKPGCFDTALADVEIDCKANVSHDNDRLLGRYYPAKGVESLKLSVDDIGLKFEIDLPNTTLARDSVELIKAGAISGCSVAVLISEDKWEGKYNSYDVRQIISMAKLFDICITPDPAFPDTIVSASKYGLSAMTAEDYKAMRPAAPYKVPPEIYAYRLRKLKMELDV